MNFVKTGVTCPTTGRDIYSLFFKAAVVEEASKTDENLIIKASSADSGNVGILEGYASTFNNGDECGDIVRKGAFKKSLSERAPKICWQHEWHNPIGVIKQAYEDNKGLFVTIELNLDVQQGREAYALYKQGAMDSFSIGAMLQKYEIVENVKTGEVSFDVKELKLLEISCVTFPANEQALVTAVKETMDKLGEDVLSRDMETLAKSGSLEELIDALSSIKTRNEEAFVEFIRELQDEQDEAAKFLLGL